MHWHPKLKKYWSFWRSSFSPFQIDIRSNLTVSKTANSCLFVFPQANSGTLSADREVRSGFGREGVAVAVGGVPPKMPRPPCRTHFSRPRVFPFQNRTRIALSARGLNWGQAWTSSARTAVVQSECGGSARMECFDPNRIALQAARPPAPKSLAFASKDLSSRILNLAMRLVGVWGSDGTKTT